MMRSRDGSVRERGPCCFHRIGIEEQEKEQVGSRSEGDREIGWPGIVNCREFER